MTRLRIHLREGRQHAFARDTRIVDQSPQRRLATPGDGGIEEGAHLVAVADAAGVPEQVGTGEPLQRVGGGAAAGGDPIAVGQQRLHQRKAEPAAAACDDDVALRPNGG